LEFPTKYEAIDAEKQIKKWNKAKKTALIEGNIELLRILSKNASLKSICLENYATKKSPQ